MGSSVAQNKAFFLHLAHRSNRNHRRVFIVFLLFGSFKLCLNKSTVARSLTCLEDKGYISRTPLPNDKRQFAVYPTEKMLAVLPEIKKASSEWMSLLSEGIPQEELDIFDSVLERMQARAREIIQSQEETK